MFRRVIKETAYRNTSRLQNQINPRSFSALPLESYDDAHDVTDPPPRTVNPVLAAAVSTEILTTTELTAVSSETSTSSVETMRWLRLHA